MKIKSKCLLTSIAILIIVLILGGLLTQRLADFSKQEYRRDLLQHAEIAAGSIDPGSVVALLGSDAHAKAENCGPLWQRLKAVQQVNSAYQDVYLMQLKEGQVRFLIDVEDAVCSDYSGAEGLYDEASKELRESLVVGQSFVEGPLADRWGEWVSGIAPLLDPQTGKVMAVLGIDVDAAEYNAQAADHRVFGVVISVLFGSFTLLANFTIWRLHERRSRLQSLNQTLTQEVAARRRLEKEQTEHLMFFQVLLNAIPTPVLFKDAAGKYLGCNRALEGIMGVKQEQLVGRTAADVFPGEHLKKVQQKNQELLELGPQGSLSYQTAITVANGRVREAVAFMANFPDSSGQLGGSVSIYLDITEQKEMEAALQESESRFRSVFSNVAAGMVVVDANGHILQVNPAFCRFLGYSEVELLQLNHTQVTYHADMEAATQIYREGSQNPKGFDLEKRYVHKDGTLIWGRVTGTWVLDGEGKPSHAVVLIIDITEAKAAIDSLRVQKDLLDNVINHVPASIFWKNRDLTYAGCNEALARQAGFGSPAEMVGKTDYDMAWEKAEADFYRDCDRKVMQRGQPMLNIEESQLQADGKKATLLTSKVPLTDPAGEVVGMLGIFTDITERKALEAEIIHAKELAEQSSRSKSEFLANMSHEIRTPMNGIIGMTDLVLGSNLDMEQRECLEMASQSAKSLLTLLNDLLDYSKAEAGKMSFEKIDFDLGLLVQGVLNPAKMEAQFRQIAVTSEIDPKLNRIFLGDPVRIKQVLSNLLGNALKFTDSGTIDFNAKVISNGGKSCTVQFTISDTGIGVPEDQLESIFDSFAQVDGSSCRKYGGTGLGLTISRELVVLMGGKIWAESILGQGSRFHVVLPLTLGEVTTLTPPPAKSGYVWTKGARLNLLLAEDSPVNQRLVVKLLEKAGHRVTLANDGQEAVQALQAEAYDLVLMDVQMPNLDGLEATALIRAGLPGIANPNLPIIALTAHAMKGDRERFLAAGMDAYISKPIHADELLEVIVSHCSALSEQVASFKEELPSNETIDYEMALSRLGDDRELLNEALDAFACSVPNLLKRLKAGMHRTDCQVMQREAHSLKGAAAAIGAKRLREMALRLEIAAGDRAIDKCHSLAPGLEKALAEVFSRLNRDFAESDNG